MSIEIKNMSVGDINKASRSSVEGTRDASPADDGAAKAGTGTDRTGNPGDSVTLTQGGKQLAQLDAAGGNQPPVDAQRVQSIKQSVQDGSYTIDHAKVADKLLGMEAAHKR
ncbi:MAG: flagellar biosynthesis anti-sigma factor FlgM [Gammaproteobacteria bacterium]|jgi:negative regulator of flagellin synthesis FlgM